MKNNLISKLDRNKMNLERLVEKQNNIKNEILNLENKIRNQELALKGIQKADTVK